MTCPDRYDGHRLVVRHRFRHPDGRVMVEGVVVKCSWCGRVWLIDAPAKASKSDLLEIVARAGGSGVWSDMSVTDD